MGSLFGTTTQPTAAAPTVGMGTQSNFFDALYNLGMGSNTGPNGPQNAFLGMAPYTGQLTPDLSSNGTSSGNPMLSTNLWNSYSPTNPVGNSQMQSMLTGINSGIGQVSPYVSQIQQGTPQMNAFAGGQAPKALSSYLGGTDPLASYANGGQQVSYPLAKPTQVQATPGQQPGTIAKILQQLQPQQSQSNPLMSMLTGSGLKTGGLI